MRIQLFWPLLLLLAACNPLRPQPLEPPQPPARYGTESPKQSLTLSDRWWRDFSDPQLNQLQDRMFSGNLNLRQALHRLTQLDAQRRSQAANRAPTLNLQGNLSRDSAPAATGPTRSTTARLSVAAAYEVDLWNRLRDRETAATLRLEAGEKDVQALLLSLSAQLTEQYFLAVEQRAQLDLLDRQAEHNRELLEVVTRRYRAGLSSAVELYQARQNLAILESRRPPLRTALTRAQNAMALLLGQPPGSVTITRRELPRLQNPVAIGLPADLLTRRPDLSAALLQLRAADHDLSAALADQLPAVNLSATLGRSVTRLASGDIEGTLWNLALGITQPLLDGDRRAAESDRQRAIRAEQLAIWQEALLTALQDVDNAFSAEQDSAARAERLAEQLRINRETLELTRRNYLAGLSDSQDLLTSRINRLDLLSQQLSNRRQWLIHRISLARALGGGWMDAELNRQQEQLGTQQTNHQSPGREEG